MDEILEVMGLCLVGLEVWGKWKYYLQQVTDVGKGGVDDGTGFLGFSPCCALQS